MYIYIYLPTFTIIYYKNQAFTYQSHAKDSGFVTFFPSPKKTTVKQSPCLESKTTHRIHQAMCTRRSQPALAVKKVWRFGHLFL